MLYFKLYYFLSQDNTPNKKELEFACEEQNKRIRLSAQDSPKVEIKDEENGTKDNVVSDEIMQCMIASDKGLLRVPSSISANKSSAKKPSKSVLTTHPKVKQAGHTGYLTFCIVPPDVPRPALAPLSSQS